MRALGGLLGAALLLVAPAASGHATIVIVNGDGPNTGFNDPTPVDPVGGNPGTTLGAQRLAVFQAAAAIWGETLDSAIPITVLAHFQPLSCSSAGATLGSAGPIIFFSSDDPSLDGGVAPTVFPLPKTWYVSAETQRFAAQKLLSGTGTDEANYDIVARFNSALDNPQTANCGGLTWYYGLDDQHGTANDLLTVVLHELGHGLGFLSLTNNSTGEFPAMNEPDIWSRFIYDEASGSHWADLSASGRVASAVSGGLGWDGPSAKAAVPNTLAFPPLVRVTSAPNTPSVVKDYAEVRVAQFSGPIPNDGVTGPLAVGSTRWGCTALGRLDPLDGRLAILDRGGPTPDAGCTFVEKARNAQDAGALGLLIANNTTDPKILIPSGTAPDVTIPVLMMTQSDGQALKDAVGAGPVKASIVRDASHGYQGADASLRPLLYSPTTLEVGSSVSHWDTSAFPNLLMEPIINPDLGHDLDLTVPLLRDIGWYLVDVAISGSGPATLGAGQQGTFTFTVTNPGPSPASAVTVSNALTGLTFVSNSGDCTTAFPCTLGDLPAGTSKTITTVLTANSTAGAVTQATVASSSNFNSTNDSAKVNVNGGISTPDAGTGGGGGGSTSSCASSSGPPAPWLALLGLLAFVRRRRPV